jgi:hypothetical protein
MPDAHAEHPDVEIAESDRTEAAPCPKHVASIEATHAVVGFVAGLGFGDFIAPAADQMPE